MQVRTLLDAHIMLVHSPAHPPSIRKINFHMLLQIWNVPWSPWELLVQRVWVHQQVSLEMLETSRITNVWSIRVQLGGKVFTGHLEDRRVSGDHRTRTRVGARTMVCSGTQKYDANVLCSFQGQCITSYLVQRQKGMFDCCRSPQRLLPHLVLDIALASHDRTAVGLV